MSGASLGNRPVRVVIRRAVISGASSIDARRMADAIPAALEHAFERLRDARPAIVNRRSTAAERAARKIADVVAERLRGTS